MSSVLLFSVPPLYKRDIRPGPAAAACTGKNTATLTFFYNEALVREIILSINLFFFLKKKKYNKIHKYKLNATVITTTNVVVSS